MKILGRLCGLATAIRTFAEVRRLSRKTPEAFAAWQAERLDLWLRTAPRRVRRYADASPRPALADFPVIEKADLMADFAAFNRPGISAEAGWSAFAGDRMVGPYHVGASTGTSGNRGLYVISDQERFAWLGAILAKAVPDIWKPWTPAERVAVILPLHTRLYDAAKGSGRVQVRFFDITQGFEAWAAELRDFAPTTVVAPPKVLRWMAETWDGPAPRRMFSGAEVLDAADRAKVEARFGLTLGQIYMATEGLLAVSCPHGTLHLCEDIMRFEMEPVGDTGLGSPVITDFRRETQIMLRYRMNDLLRLSDAPCPCGSPCRGVSEIVGRQDDAFLFRDGKMITPDVLRNAVVDADRRIDDFRLVQTDPEHITLRLKADLPADAAVAARSAVAAVIAAVGVSGVSVTTEQADLPPPTDRKLRRVERLRGA